MGLVAKFVLRISVVWSAPVRTSAPASAAVNFALVSVTTLSAGHVQRKRRFELKGVRSHNPAPANPLSVALTPAIKMFLPWSLAAVFYTFISGLFKKAGKASCALWIGSTIENQLCLTSFYSSVTQPAEFLFNSWPWLTSSWPPPSPPFVPLYVLVV